MAQEEKKPDENLKAEESNKTDLDNDEKKEEAKVEEEKKVEESKLEEASVAVPQEIILRVYMHCEGCARKVRRCLKGFQGVESVETDCKTHRVVVKGEKADPLDVLERVQKKSHRQVDLISPIPIPIPKPPLPTPEIQKQPKTEEIKPEIITVVLKADPLDVLERVQKKSHRQVDLISPIPIPKPPRPTPEIQKPPKTEEIKPEIITVVLKVHMHCEACAQEIKRRILKMKGVETVEADLKSSQVTVKGAIDPPTLAEYVYKRTGKHAVIVKQDPQPQPQPQPDEKANGPSDTVKKDDKAEENEKKVDHHEEKDKTKEEEAGDKGEGEAKTEEATVKAMTEEEEEEVSKVVQVEMEMKKNEYYYPQYGNFNYPQSYIMEMYAYPPNQIIAGADDYPPPMVGVSYPPPPQMFSDENPNACSLM